MLIKAGVDISKLNTEIRKALNEISYIYNHQGEELVITSTYEGSHSAGSKHYANDAVDIRKPHNDIADVLNSLEDNLGTRFFVLEETTHIHIHYIRSIP